MIIIIIINMRVIQFTLKLLLFVFVLCVLHNNNIIMANDSFITIIIIICIVLTFMAGLHMGGVHVGLNVLDNNSSSVAFSTTHQRNFASITRNLWTLCHQHEPTLVPYVDPMFIHHFQH